MPYLRTISWDLLRIMKKNELNKQGNEKSYEKINKNN